MATTTSRPVQLERALFAVKMGAMILGDKVVMLLALVLNFSLFAYSVLYPDPTRFAIAGMFSITVFLPILYYHYPRRKYGPTIQETDQTNAA